MTHRVLLDANLLIAALDTSATTSADKRAEAKERLTALLNDPEVALAITPLIRYEVLRFPAWGEQERFTTLQNMLDDFEEFDIGRDVAELAANLYRLDKAKADAANAQRNLEKRKFDVFHFASAKHNGLELASQDTDITKIQGLYEEYEKSKQ
jgi:predicted nucleic acid-binding protein